jgi:arginine:ornithine antiporter / lysine permease
MSELKVTKAADGDTLNKQGVGVTMMAAFAIGGTLASGVFYLPGNMAYGGGIEGGVFGLGMLIGWIVCGLGIFALVLAYYAMSVSKPEMKSGLYTYSKAGFGEYVGFNVAWGYWASALLAQVSFCIALFTGLGQFVPAFEGGATAAAIICASILIWAFVLLISMGVREAMVINFGVVVAKIIPILTLIVVIIFGMHFKLSLFLENFIGGAEAASLFDQVKATMMFTVWVFVGFEAAIVASGRSKDAKTAGKGTLISFVCLLLIYVSISLLSMGVMSQADLLALGANGDLSVANVMAEIVGPWGMTFVAIAVIISVGGAMYNYTLLCAECCYMPAKDGTFPKALAKTNKHGAPIASLIFTMGVVQLFLIITVIWSSGYYAMLSISASMIMFPYFVSALYSVKVTVKGENMWAQESKGSKVFFLIVTIFASLYGMWMLYAAGLDYALITALLYAPGVIIHLVARKQRGLKPFDNMFEIGLFVVILVAFVFSIVLIASGKIQPF